MKTRTIVISLGFFSLTAFSESNTCDQKIKALLHVTKYCPGAIESVASEEGVNLNSDLISYDDKNLEHKLSFIFTGTILTGPQNIIGYKKIHVRRIENSPDTLIADSSQQYQCDILDSKGKLIETFPITNTQSQKNH